MMVFVLVCQNIKEILINNVDQNVFLIMIVPKIELVLRTSAWIHVLELAGKMPYAQLSIIFRCVVVKKDILETRLYSVVRTNVRLLN